MKTDRSTTFVDKIFQKIKAHQTWRATFIGGCCTEEGPDDWEKTHKWYDREGKLYDALFEPGPVSISGARALAAHLIAIMRSWRGPANQIDEQDCSNDSLPIRGLIAIEAALSRLAA